MRPITSFALHAIAAAALTAFAASSAAAETLKLSTSKGRSDASAGGGASKGKEKWIEIQGWDWGDTARADGLAIKQGGKPPAKGNVEYTWKVEEGESAPPPPGGVRVASGDVNGDSSAASGLPTGKRQHKPVTFTKPLDKGSVWVRVASPWAACRVGARYPSLELSDGAERYLLQDVTVANCGGRAAGNDRPTEEVAFYYNRIAFNYAK